MVVERFDIEGLMLFKQKSYADERGFFVERFSQKQFDELGLIENLVQDNFSRSKPRVLRGLHYQHQPAQGKLVTCLRGEILDVAVDIRKGSNSFGRHVTVRLSGDDPQWFWLPAGFAHGFVVLGDEPADVLYKVNRYYNPHGEGAIIWNDPELKIDWGLETPILSSKDEAASTFQQYASSPVF